jgi:hypothetical protein
VAGTFRLELSDDRFASIERVPVQLRSSSQVVIPPAGMLDGRQVIASGRIAATVRLLVEVPFVLGVTVI